MWRYKFRLYEKSINIIEGKLFPKASEFWFVSLFQMVSLRKTGNKFLFCFVFVQIWHEILWH